ncbi:ComEC/Rec2 family competence protein [Kordiimonas pumila]|uniref:ComEC/Rec2 family competence protein n=1 Tax=Kordiimonas pumila TaxID=2161677 RepID=A0ABV7D314_9PROT|nr:hypothetical protein [Kordiimonas pumila]
MNLKIFDVEHGACALLTCDDNTRLMLDAGHNATTGWRPGDYLVANGIHRLDMLAITNYDEDHVSGIENLLDQVDVSWLSRNVSVSTGNLRELKSEDGMGNGMAKLCQAIDHTFTGDGSSPLPTFSGLQREKFSCSYPNFDDENNLSLVNFLDCNGTGVLFTGDLERAGWEHLVQKASFRNAMAATNILIAPHHGRIKESDRDFFREFYRKYFPNVYYVVISDKGYQHDTQQTLPLFQSFAKGGPFRDGTRKVLTTRKDGLIEFRLEDGSWGPF